MHRSTALRGLVLGGDLQQRLVLPPEHRSFARTAALSWRPASAADFDQYVWLPVQADGTIQRQNEPYAEAMRIVADQLDVHVIDLHAISIEMYETLYDEVGATAGIELHFDDGSEGRDRTHFNSTGARFFANEVGTAFPQPFARYGIGD